MVSNHHQPTTRTQRPFRLLQHILQRLQLPVYLDTQSLIHLCQILLLLLFRHAGCDHLQKLFRASNHLPRPGIHYQINQPSHVIHLPVVPKNPNQILLAICIQNIRSLQPTPLVHPHIQFRIKPEGETPSRLVKLVRRHTQIGQNPVRLVVPAVAQEIPQIPKIMIHKNKPTIIRHVSQRIGILIETDQATILQSL